MPVVPAAASVCGFRIQEWGYRLNCPQKIVLLGLIPFEFQQRLYIAEN